MAMHAHREGHLTLHVQGTPCTMTVSDRKCPISPGHAVAVNPWEPHNFVPGDPENGTLMLVLYIKPIWFLQAGRTAKGALRFGRSRIEMNEQITRLLQLVSTLLLESESSDLFEGYLYELTRECFDQTWQWSPTSETVADKWGGVRDFRVRNSIRLMKERINDDLVLDKIARDSGLSRPHFYKLFRQNVGLTPNIYLNTLRMENAIDRLTTSSDAVTAIGLDLGFASQASFTRFFTSNVGIPPTDYRRVAHFAL